MKELTVIVLMALSNPFPSNHIIGELEQQILCRTLDNKYVIVVQNVDSNDVKFLTDTLPKSFGDTVQLDSGQYTPIHKAALDGFLKYEYENDSVRYDELRKILIYYPAEKPCIYYDPPSTEYRLG